MNRPKELLADADALGFVLEPGPAGDNIIAVPFGGTYSLPRELRERLREGKDHLLEYLTRRDRARAQLDATNDRISAEYDRCDPSCRVGGPEWEAHDKNITKAMDFACETGNSNPLRDALALYEDFATYEFKANADLRACLEGSGGVKQLAIQANYRG
jgi:hypothetical protein